MEENRVDTLSDSLNTREEDEKRIGRRSGLQEILFLLRKRTGLQEILFLLLLLWVLMPAVFLPLRALAELLWERSDGKNYLNTVILDVYAKYFYSLGAATVCAAIAALARNLPTGRELRSAARRLPWHACLAFMLFWSVLSTLFSGNPVSRFWGLRYHNDGLSSYFIYAAVYICALFLAQSGRRLVLLRTFSVVGCFCAVMGFWQIIDSISQGLSAANAMTAVFFNINHCAYFLTMGVLSAAGLWMYDPASDWRIWHLISFVTQVYALLLNDTFGCFLAVLLALPLACVFRFRSGRRDVLRALVPCILFLLLTAASVTGILPASPHGGVAASALQTQQDVAALLENPESMRGGSGRVILWKGAVEQTVRHPLFGLGPDSPVLPSSQSRIIRAHNEFLQHAMLLGIPALAAYLTAIFTLLAYRWKRLRDTDGLILTSGGVVAGYLISSCFGITIFYTTPFFFLFLGLTAGSGVPASDSGTGTAKEPGEALSPWPQNRMLAATAGCVLMAAIVLPMEAALFEEAERERSDADCCLVLDSYLEQIEDIVGADNAWFDIKNRVLLSMEDAPPEPYGRGTALNGKTYTGSELSVLQYNLETDYRGCVLLVRAKREDGKTSFTREWVRIDEASA